MIKRVIFLFLGLAGAALLYTGGFIIKEESLKMVSGLCVGIGAAALVLGIGNFIKPFLVSPLEEEKFKKQKDIEVNDERNIRIKEKSGYMVSKVMNYIISCLVLVMGFMNVNKLIIIMVVSLLVAELVLYVGFSNYYSKRM